MSILLPLIFTLVFCFIIWKWKWFHDPSIPKYLFIFFFIIKVLAGIFAGDLYLKRYNGGDTFTFFQNSVIITESFYQDPSDFFYMVSGIGNDREFIEKYGEISAWDNNDVVYNDNRTIIRINAIIGLVSMRNYNVHVIFFAFMSMIGLIGIFKGIRLLTNQSPFLVVSFIFLIPGVIFWLSMASKESILMFAMGMLFYTCVSLLTISKSFLHILGMFLAGFLFVHIKAYFLVLITPALIAFSWTIATGNRYAPVKYLAVYFAFGLLFFGAKYMTDGFDPVQIVFMKRYNFEAFAQAFPREMASYIEVPSFTSDWHSVLAATPQALSSVLLRPFLWESDSLLITFAAIENVLILLSLAIGLIYFNRESAVKNSNLIMFCLFFVLSVFVLIGLTTPVMGAIVRYKAPVLPFLCLIPVLISGGDKSPFKEKI
jgi:hypothetical protein